MKLRNSIYEVKRLEQEAARLRQEGFVSQALAVRNLAEATRERLERREAR